MANGPSNCSFSFHVHEVPIKGKYKCKYDDEAIIKQNTQKKSVMSWFVVGCWGNLLNVEILMFLIY